jgi:hypothetical protein
MRTDEARIRFRVAADGRLEPVAVEMDQVLSNRMLAGIPFGRLEAIANSSRVGNVIKDLMDADESQRPITVRTGWRPSEVAGMLQRVNDTLAQSPTRYPSGFYEDIAALYELHVAGVERVIDDMRAEDEPVSEKRVRKQRQTAPVKFMAERLGVPTSTVFRWVRVCRERGLLPEARHGKKG